MGNCEQYYRQSCRLGDRSAHRQIGEGHRSAEVLLEYLEVEKIGGAIVVEISFCPCFAVDAWRVVVEEDFQIVSVDGPVAVGVAWHGGDESEEFAAGFGGA